MPITVDYKKLAVKELGFNRFSEVLGHVGQSDRLVVNVLIDGQPADWSTLQQMALDEDDQRHIFIETASPGELAGQALEEARLVLEGADSHRHRAIETLRSGDLASAVTDLQTCLSAWKTAEEAVQNVSQLLGLDMEQISTGGRTLADFLMQFTQQLRQVRDALVNRDNLLLADLLEYELAEPSAHWIEIVCRLGPVQPQ